jgi:hypothetical protein
MLGKRFFVLISVFGLSLSCVHEAFGDTDKNLPQSLERLKSVRQAIQQKTLTLLVLLKRLEGEETGEMRQQVKIIKPTAAIHETDNEESRTLIEVRLNDEFPVLEQRDRWYRIPLRDGREGWVHEDNIQPFSVPVVKPPSSSGRDAILPIASDLIKDINAGQESSAKLLSGMEETYRQMPDSGKQTNFMLFREMMQERDKITEYHILANRFYNKYAPSQLPSGSPVAGMPAGISGQLSMLAGKSSHETEQLQFLTSRDIELTTALPLGQRSKATASFSSRSEVIETPYSANDVQLGYAYQSPAGLNLNTTLTYNGYTDQAYARNNFNQTGVGFNLNCPLKTSSVLFAQGNYTNKDYKDQGSNGYRGGQFNTGLRLKAGLQTQWTLSMQGIIQKSDISFLDFNRFMPQVQWLRRTDGGSRGARFEFETIGYTQEAKNNNFGRQLFDFLWSQNGTQRQLTVVAKQFPNNQGQSYVKFEGQTGWRKGNASKFSRTRLSLLWVQFTQTGAVQNNYADLRVDQSTGGMKTSLDFSLFGRFWSKPDQVAMRNHLLDIYGRWGWKFSRFQIGPLVGAHLLLNKHAKVFKRDGNSLRAGLDCSANFTVGGVTIDGSLRYEKDFVFGKELSIDVNSGQLTYGDVVVRRPRTIQVAFGAQIPISRDLDFRLDMSSYSIDTDLNDKTSINPVATRSRFVIKGGYIYRFGS